MEIKFDKVHFTYDKINFHKREVLNNINLIFKEGKINALIGKSGSGKTTLVEIIYGVLRPSSGNVLIDNVIMNEETKERIRFDIGMVFQDVNEQFFNKTVKEELEANLKLYNYRIDELQKRIIDALIMVGLSDEYLNLNISLLSSGEKKKVALASALVLNPKILILDEPMVGLDLKSKKELIKLLRLLKNRYKKTIVIISNNLDFILENVDYVYVLNDKKIVMEGKKLDVFKQVDKLKKYGIIVPNIIFFEDLVLKKKGIKLGYRDEINDLIKDIYRCAK